MRGLQTAGAVYADLGGDIAFSSPPNGVDGWRIELEDPREAGGIAGIICLPGGGIATSGITRRTWTAGGEVHHHLIDPRTGRPATTDLLSVTVMAPTAAAAEVAAKSVLLLGSEAGRLTLLQSEQLAGVLQPHPASQSSWATVATAGSLWSGDLDHMDRELDKLSRFSRAALRFAVALAAVVLIAWLGGRLIGGSGFAGTAPWYISRAAGIVAYGLLSLSSLLGITMATQFWSRRLSRLSLNALHEQLSWLALGFLVLHVGALLVDTFLPFRVVDILVPLLSAYRPVPVGLGIVTFYLIALLNVSFYVQNRIGHRAWRVILYASFAAYALATVHGILAGNGTGQPWMQAIYATSLALVLAATAYRLLRRPALDQAARNSSAARG